MPTWDATILNIILSCSTSMVQYALVNCVSPPALRLCHDTEGSRQVIAYVNSFIEQWHGSEQLCRQVSLWQSDRMDEGHSWMIIRVCVL